MKEFKINDENKITSGFTTPEGYFENFTIDLQNNESHQKTDRKVISINTKRWLTSVAAVLIVAISESEKPMRAAIGAMSLSPRSE